MRKREEPSLVATKKKRIGMHVPFNEESNFQAIK